MAMNVLVLKDEGFLVNFVILYFSRRAKLQFASQY
jgi:hypothetical protein